MVNQTFLILFQKQQKMGVDNIPKRRPFSSLQINQLLLTAPYPHTYRLASKSLVGINWFSDLQLTVRTQTVEREKLRTLIGLWLQPSICQHKKVSAPACTVPTGTQRDCEECSPLHSYTQFLQFHSSDKRSMVGEE